MADLSAMSPDRRPLRARVCSCDRPLLTDDTCLRCGRALSLLPEPSAQPPKHEVNWSRAHVARAFQAFAFFRGRAPVVTDWRPRMDDWPPLDAVETLFGTLEAALRAAGLERRAADVR
jgi:hypothetical protein